MTLEWPPIDGPTEGLLVYVVYGANDQPIYVGSTKAGMKRRLSGHKFDSNLQQWARQHGSLHITTMNGFASELDMRTEEESLLQRLRPPCNRSLVVQQLTALLNQQVTSVSSP